MFIVYSGRTGILTFFTVQYKFKRIKKKKTPITIKRSN